MNKIEKQILKNQLWIIKNTSAINMEEVVKKGIIYDEIEDLLNPQESKEETCCEMPEEEKQCGHASWEDGESDMPEEEQYKERFLTRE